MDYKNPDQMQIYLKEHLSKKRFSHSMRVAKSASDLAKVYHVDADRAYFAGLVHDMAKELDDNTCITFIEKANIVIDPCIEMNPNLAHGEIAAYLLETEFGIDDEAILSAVKWHTYGHENMTTLDKVVYLADVIEPVRSFENIEELRKLAYEDLDKAIEYFFELCTLYLSRQNQPIHQNTYKMLKSLHCIC